MAARRSNRGRRRNRGRFGFSINCCPWWSFSPPLLSAAWSFFRVDNIEVEETPLFRGADYRGRRGGERGQPLCPQRGRDLSADPGAAALCGGGGDLLPPARHAGDPGHGRTAVAAIQGTAHGGFWMRRFRFWSAPIRPALPAIPQVTGLSPRLPWAGSWRWRRSSSISWRVSLSSCRPCPTTAWRDRRRN